MSAELSSENIEIVLSSSLSSFKVEDLQNAAALCVEVCANSNPNRFLSNAGVLEGMHDVLSTGKGMLVIGKSETDKSVVSLAAGHEDENGSFFIDGVIVSPLEQKKGIGKATLSALLEEADPSGKLTLKTEVDTKDDSTLAIYAAAGFKMTDFSQVSPSHQKNGEILLDDKIQLFKKDDSEENMKEQVPQTLNRTAILYPSGNTTAVVFDQRLDSDRGELNEGIMTAWKKQASDQPEIEQCCFVTTPQHNDAIARVEMFGGEFCGNATRSVIWMLTEGKDYSGKIEVSGVEQPLSFNVKNGVVSVEMPLPKENELVKEVEEGTLVQLDGISQLVVSDEQLRGSSSPRELLTKLLAGNEYGLADQPAVGVSYYDEATKQSEFCVWVKNVDTIFDETACGSGTSAIGVALANTTNTSQHIEVIQPSGKVITTDSKFDTDSGKIVESTIAGEVEVLYDGKIELDNN